MGTIVGTTDWQRLARRDALAVEMARLARVLTARLALDTATIPSATAALAMNLRITAEAFEDAAHGDG